ncbi:hypothetical protein FHQ18_08730 [Deferribacter autotrophicus]|uniref:Peptidylprolyl isomerase n=1 Tax=Deferribacter autotrophicus TaxID=500465 RepID=A0A5A8F174_9BACT|nr:hypothetical protein [Deferribacter autotrophicus]KAA0257818.1 hypothetical protein FHQ18_08730 [Deferribacter autotrophicus]
MRKKFFYICLALLIFSVNLFAQVVAKIDDFKITDDVLKKYVDEVAGEKYKNYLKSDSGKRKLAEYYINRYVLLKYAKEIYKEEDLKKLKQSHPELDTDTLYLLHLIDEKINKQIKIDDKELEKFMKSNGISNKNSAYANLLTIKRKKMLDDLLNKLKQEHNIVFNIN